MMPPTRIVLGVPLVLLWAWAPVSQAQPEESDTPTAARKVIPPPPSRPVADLAGDLTSPTASVRAEAAKALAGARSLPARVWDALDRLARDDPDRTVRLAALRTRYLLVIHGVRASIGDAYDEGPRPVGTESPRYPREARQRRITGVVRVLVLINEQGDVEDAEIIESIPVLDDAALRCVRRWKFEPGTKGGKPTPTYAIAPLSFTGTTRTIGF